MGGTFGSSNLSLNNSATGPANYVENLGASFGSGSGATGTGSFTGLASGATNNGLSVSLSGVATAGTNNGSIALNLNSEAVNGSGLGTTTLTGKTVAVSGFGYTGQGVYNTAGGSWGTFGNWQQTGGYAGLDGSLSANDTATFGTGGSGSVTLDGAAPSIQTLTFSNASSGYTLAQGTGGSLTLKTGNTAASINNNAGSHTISADVILANDTTLNAASGTALNISGAVSGSGKGLTKAGTGAATFSGNNTYSGATFINEGLLTVNGSLNGSGTVSVGSTGTLGGSGSVGAVTVNSGGTLAPGNSPGTLTVASSIWNDGGNYNWQLYNATGSAGSAYDTIASSGNLNLSSLTAGGFKINLWTIDGLSSSSGSAINFDPNGAYSWSLGSFGSISGFDASKFTINTSATNGTTGFANSFMAGGFKVTTNGSGQLLLTYQGASPVWTGGSGNLSTIGTTNGSALVFTGSGGNVTNNAQVSSLSSMTFSNTAGATTFSGSALTNGSGGIVNNSAVTQTVSLPLTLGADQSFNAASGNLAISGNVANNGNTLTLAGASNTTVDGNISGNGGVTKADSGTATLSGNNTYSGTTTVNGGTLVAGSSTALSGAGALTVNNGSTLALGSYNTTAGAVTLNSGSITGSGTLTGTGYTVSSGTIAPTLAGAGVTLTKTGLGSVTLNAAETFTGKTTISAGTLILGSGSSLASTNINLGTRASQGTLDASALSGGAITIGNGQTLAGYGTLVGNTTIASGATLAPGNSPGVIGITGDLTLNSGSTSIFEVVGLGGAGASNGFDQVNVNGTSGLGGLLTYGGVLKLDISGMYGKSTSFQDYLFHFGSQTGGFSNVQYKLNSGAWTDLTYYSLNNTWQMWDTSALSLGAANAYVGINLNTGVLTVVPEPSTWALLVGGVSTLVILRRRKQS